MIMDALAGEQKGVVQVASVKTTPCWANRSMFGVGKGPP
jgi:hypothetical protein